MKLLNKREVEILHLLTNSKGYQTGNSIAVLLEVSARTIRNDMKQLNATLRDHGAIIVSHKGMGYELEVSDEGKFQKLYQEYVSTGDQQAAHSNGPTDDGNMEEAIIRKLLMNNLTNSSINQEELAEALFISLTALKSYLPTVKAKLSRFGLKVKTDRFDGMRITGEEDKIRYCISAFLFKLQNMEVYNELFPKNEFEVLKDITIQALLNHQFRLTDVSLENLIIHMEITIKRFMHKRQIEYNSNEMEVFEDTKEFFVAQDIVNNIKARLNIDIQSEIYYITQHLLASNRLTGSYIDTQDYKNIETMLDQVITEIKEITSIDFNKDQQLKEGLIIHLSVALKRIFYQMNIRNELLNNIKNNYPLAFQLAVIASNEISRIVKLDIDENEIGFLAIHFGVALEKKGLNKQQIKKILIVCGSGIATATLIKDKILNYYGQQISVVKTISLAEFQEAMLDEVDLVVSTVAIPNIDSEKILIIKPVISNQDLTKIKHRVLDTNFQGNVHHYRNMFKKDLFIKNLKLNNKEEVLDYLTTKMEEKQYINAYTKNSILEREKMASTELCNLLAIPHPLDNHMTEIAIAVCVLDKPIAWDREKVQVVIVLSVPKSEQKKWEFIFKQLYHFLIEDFGITKLISTYSYEDFIRNLTKYKE